MIDRFLCELPGFVENDDDPICRRDVQTRDDLLEFEVLEKAIEAKLEAWNTDSVDGKPSRYDIWKNSPGASLTSPEDIRLELLAGEDHVKRKTAVVRDVGIEYKRTFYKLEDKEDSYDRWAEAAAERREIQFRAITLHHGLLVLVDLNDGHGWERVVPQSKQRPSKKKHVIKQRATVKRFHGKLGEAEEKYKQALATRMGGLPKTDAIDKEPYFPSEMKALDSSAENSTLAREVSTASDTNASKPLSPVSIPLDLDAPKNSLMPPDTSASIVDDVVEPKTLEEGSMAAVPEPLATPVVPFPLTREEQIRANAKANLAARLRQHTLSKDTNGAGEPRS